MKCRSDCISVVGIIIGVNVSILIENNLVKTVFMVKKSMVNIVDLDIFL